MSLSIKNCRILKNRELVNSNIFVENGKISKIGPFVEADEIIDAKNNIVIPGLIDSHVHFREPGFEHKEDFFSGSRAATAGGVTTVLDMPNTKPATITVEALEKKRELAKKSVVNYGFHFGTLGDNMEEIKKAKNIASVKVYMGPTTGNMMIEDEELLRNVFSSYKIILAHAENNMIEKAVNLSHSLNNKLYVCHINTKKGLDFISQNRKNVFVEVTPHHLFLTEKDENNLVKMKPSLGTGADRDALWQGLNSGLINTIGTDHAPHTLEEKEEKTLYGVPGVETMLPLLLDAVNKNRLSLQKLVELTSLNPSKIFGIKNKGQLKEGFDADIVLVDMGLKKKIKNENLFTKCKWSPFENWELTGWPVTTIVNGNIVFQEGEVHDIKAKEVVFNGAV